MRKTIIIWSALAAAALPGTALADPLTSQEIGQVAGSQQSASSSATSTQKSPTNTAISVAILSPGAKSGNVTQSNSSSAESAAGNKNETEQNAAQNAGGSGSAGQFIGQAAGNKQDAESEATSTQYHPTNQAISVAILSPGAKSGDVKQSNSSSAESQAGNKNETTQNASQNAGGGQGGKSDKCCDKGGTTVQGIGQEAYNKQDADSKATSVQYDPTNQAIGVSILSGGSSSGDVDQSNSSEAESAAGNKNETEQNASQEASGGSHGCSDKCEPSKRDGGYGGEDSCYDKCDHGGTTVQGIGQLNKSKQDADSEASSEQYGASNVAGALDVLDGLKGHEGKKDGYGDHGSEAKAAPAPSGGDVKQSNSSSAESEAGNSNETEQNASQSAFGGGTTVQALGQAAFNDQQADSEAESTQWCPVNEVFGSFGDVDQSNDSQAESASGNRNGTEQNASQAANWWKRERSLL
jgi:hypothetical protein